MHDLFEEKAKCWKDRLKKCMDMGGYSQATLAESLNKKYKTYYGQKDVSRWLNIGAKSKKGQVGFPKYDTMLLLADFFSVDVGYLTGETDEDSFSLEKACSYIGLSGEAIKAIREFTHPENESSHMRKDMRESFNKFFSADGFSRFFDGLCSLYLTSISPQRKHELEDIDSAIDYMYGLEQSAKIERYELNEALVLLINEIYPNPSKASISIKE